MKKLNGALDICLLWGNANTREKVKFQYTGMQIAPEEWTELFYEVLEAPKQESYIEGESFVQYDNRQKALFEKYLRNKGFPLLGRISDIYQDVIFVDSEVSELLNECKNLINSSTLSKANEALDKLIRSCEEADRSNSGIILVSD